MERLRQRRPPRDGVHARTSTTTPAASWSTRTRRRSAAPSGSAIGDGARNNVFFARPCAGAWHHYAFVLDTQRRGRDQITPYVDGQPVPYTKLNSGTGAGNFANSTLYLMSRAGNSLFGAGDLDEVAIYNRALTRLDDRRALQQLRHQPPAGRRLHDTPERSPSAGTPVTFNAAGLERPRRLDRQVRVGPRRQRQLRDRQRLGPGRPARPTRPSGDYNVRLRVTDNQTGTDVVTQDGQRRRQPAPDRLVHRHADPGRGRPAGELRRLRLHRPRRHDRQVRVGPRRQRHLRDRHRDDARPRATPTRRPGPSTSACGSPTTAARPRPRSPRSRSAANGVSDYAAAVTRHARADRLLADGRGRGADLRRQRRRSSPATRIRRGHLRRPRRRRPATPDTAARLRRLQRLGLGPARPLRHQQADGRVLAEVERLRQRRPPGDGVHARTSTTTPAASSSTPTAASARSASAIGDGASQHRDSLRPAQRRAVAPLRLRLRHDGARRLADHPLRRRQAGLASPQIACGTGRERLRQLHALPHVARRARRCSAPATSTRSPSTTAPSMPATIAAHANAHANNQSPTASFTASPNPVTSGASVTFDAAASSDPDGTIAKYEWDLDGNGSYETDTGTTATTSRSYATAGDGHRRPAGHRQQRGDRDHDPVADRAEPRSDRLLHGVAQPGQHRRQRDLRRRAPPPIPTARSPSTSGTSTATAATRPTPARRRRTSRSYATAPDGHGRPAGHRQQRRDRDHDAVADRADVQPGPDGLLHRLAEPGEHRRHGHLQRLGVLRSRRHDRQVRVGPRRQRHLRDQHGHDGDDEPLLRDRPARSRSGCGSPTTTARPRRRPAR